MINDAVEYIRREVRRYLDIDDADVIIDNAHVLKEQNNTNGAYITLVNVEEEFALKNTRHYLRENDKTTYIQPPVHLNLYLLFSFEFGNYSTSLVHLSKTIELFQSKPAFSSSNEVAENLFPTGIEKLIFDFHNLGFEQMNYLWGVLGGSYFPSVLYKVRMMKVEADEQVDAPEITTIQLGTGAQP